jgi:uncharacterized protein (TIGR00369 family)
MANEAHFRKLEAMYHQAPINAYYQPTLRIESGRTTLSVDLRPDFHHAAGAVHGSVYFKLLDDAAYFAVNSLVEDVLVLTASYNIQLLRPVVSGRVVAEGTVVRLGRETSFADAVLRDAQGQEIARGTGVFARSRIPLSPELGYREGQAGRV